MGQGNLIGNLIKFRMANAYYSGVLIALTWLMVIIVNLLSLS